MSVKALIDLDACRYNLSIAKQAAPDSKCIAIIKANAYGHGIEEIALLCQEYGIKNVFVRDLTEASIVKKYGFETIFS